LKKLDLEIKQWIHSHQQYSQQNKIPAEMKTEKKTNKQGENV